MNASSHGAGRRDLGSRGERIALVFLGAFSLLAVLGYGVFALHPANLARVPYGPEFFGLSFRFFAQAHIVLCFTALAVVLVRRTSARWIPALLAVGALSLGAEHLGTGYGVPFGGYEYTTLLGPRIGSRVPALIPVSWFLMALPCWVMARALLPRSTAARVAFGALGLVIWDLALDPAMSFLTSYWVWEETGPYYGMPWLNLAGWFVTGVALMAALDVLARDGRFNALPAGWMALYYGTVLLLPLGMLAAAGSWPGVVTTLTALSVVGAVARGVAPRDAPALAPTTASSSNPSTMVAS